MKTGNYKNAFDYNSVKNRIISTKKKKSLAKVYQLDDI